MSEYASLVFLSYKRPQFIFEAIESAVSNAGHPCEVIVVDDGSDVDVTQRLHYMVGAGEISKLVLHARGHNEGVGRGINEGFALASGDPIIKLDQDLLFTGDWLARAVGILRQDEAIGMLGLFKYHIEPVAWQDMRIDVPTKGGYHYTRQFCGSAMAIPRATWEALGPMDEHLDAFNEDSNYMARVRCEPTDDWSEGQELALPDVDLVTNRGFGIGPSTVVEEGYKVHAIHHGPHVVNAKTCAPQTGVISPSEDFGRPDDIDRCHMDALDAELDFPARPFKVGVVITTCAGREENLKRALEYVGDLNVVRPQIVGIVYDGCALEHDALSYARDIPIWRVGIEKHHPGMEQPRNVGFNAVREVVPDLTHVWFLDSDLIVPSDTLTQFYRGLCAAEEDRILIGPYDWLPPGVVGFVPEMKNMPAGVPGAHGIADYRWNSFKADGPERVFRHDLGASLACFGGNLIWPVDAFEEIGGFHVDLHHGRCEDGELGLRACERGVPMSLVRDARAWHVHHPVDGGGAMQKNARDVPLLNSMHPWVENEGLRVVDADGKRFDWKCPDCDEVHNSLSYWTHASTHR